MATPAVQEKRVCEVSMRAVTDTLEFLGGKWKLPILMALITGGKQRFMELERNVKGITPKMLSKELQDLEMNRLVYRKVLDTKPVMVEYDITEYSESLRSVLVILAEWGTRHRELLMRH
ncbi:MAG: helix-turn-helix transcriptional regulator [Chitinophagales bacterium]|nr:helix-turn-helix transcriptional regulator [Chitinophagales bacterium]